MKTKKLIQLLKQADPSGEEECCIYNHDILTVYAQEAYWDGCLEVLKRDESNPYYNVTGAKITSKGMKVVIQPHSICDATLDYPNLEVEYETEYAKRKYEHLVEEWKRKHKNICNSVERDSFVEYVKDKTGLDDKRAAVDFYDENMSHDDPMPQDIKQMRGIQKIHGKSYDMIPSWNTRRRRQWDRELKITTAEGKVNIERNI